ncbi:hypothetical protein DL93DRAFT_2167766 [Clavulina sp. PMI_390]|nr:hypothetical protein DL93DRAFT_2167766 [Clavulina sp. PMI_390]
MKFQRNPTYRTEIEFELKHSQEEVLFLLHNFEAFFGMNPAVLECKQDVSDPDMWHITEAITLPLGLPNSSTSFKARMNRTSTGFTAHSWAALGVETTSEWTIIPPPQTSSRSSKTGTHTRLRIVGTLQAPFWTFSFVKGQYRKIHAETESRVKKTLAERSPKQLGELI